MMYEMMYEHIWKIFQMFYDRLCPLLLLCFSYYRVLSLRLTSVHFYNNSVCTHTCEYLQHVKLNNSAWDMQVLCSVSWGHKVLRLGPVGPHPHLL